MVQTLRIKKNPILAFFFILTILVVFRIYVGNNSAVVSFESCKCDRFNIDSTQFIHDYESTCSTSATKRGKGQLVVSYSLYGSTSISYYLNLEEDIQEVADKYPGWVVRVYTNMSTHIFCPLMCRYEHLDVCDVTNLPSGIGNVGNRFGMLWRFLVLGDPLVERFVSRDLDSEILQREVDAVHEWIQLGSMWHVMRDHPLHVVAMLGGMWGVANFMNLSLTSSLRESILKEANEFEKGYDQAILEMIVWPFASHNVTAHDSYLCSRFENTRPFPTARINGSFVGAPRGMTTKRKCPVQCRPPTHHDWIYC